MASRLRYRIAISLDGFVVGPAQHVEHPLGRERVGDDFTGLRS